MRIERGCREGGKMPKGDRIDLVGMLGARIGRMNRPPPPPGLCTVAWSVSPLFALSSDQP